MIDWKQSEGEVNEWGSSWESQLKSDDDDDWSWKSEGISGWSKKMKACTSLLDSLLMSHEVERKREEEMKLKRKGGVLIEIEEIEKMKKNEDWKKFEVGEEMKKVWKRLKRIERRDWKKKKKKRL